jgi:PHD/YefM family antitoxin component YafN of YafNO toxin-antitoxin module
MIVKREEPITKEQFRKNFDKVLKAAGEGKGPIAITDDAEVVGFLVGPEAYEELGAAEIDAWLKSRLKETKTISHKEAMRRAKAAIRKSTKP